MKRTLVRTMSIVTAVLASVVGPPTPAPAAVVPFQAEIVCDATTGTISTRAFGYGFQPNSPVKATFTVLNGSYVTPATAGVIPQRNQSVTVPATVGPDGVIAATGYTRAWDPAPYLFYAETVEVWILHRDTGEPISSRTATCSRDLRTTLTTICDPAAKRVTATVSGVDADLGGGPGGQYHPAAQKTVRTITTSTLTSPDVWTGNEFPPLTAKPVNRDPGGATWSVQLIDADATNYDLYRIKLTVEIFGVQGNLLVGRATGGCTYQLPPTA